MAGLDRGDGIFAGAHAIEEILHVIVAHLKVDGVLGQRRLEDVIVARFQVAAVDPNPTVGAHELDAIALAFLR